jgi:hypothetical protein
MSILQRKPRKPKLISRQVTLDLLPKDRRGSISRHRRITVSPSTRDVPGVSLSMQDQSMLVGFLLDEEEVGSLVQGLRDALEASKTIAASRESQGTSQDG